MMLSKGHNKSVQCHIKAYYSVVPTAFIPVSTNDLRLGRIPDDSLLSSKQYSCISYIINFMTVTVYYAYTSALVDLSHAV